MSTDFLRAAQAEEQRLLRELESTPLYRRLEAIRALLGEYESRPPIAAKGHDTAIVPPPRAGGSRRAGGLTGQVIAAAADHLREQQRRAQSAEILDVLRSRGVEVTGQKPTAVVASILSNCDLFDNIRGQGYGLIEWSQGRTSSDPSDQSGDAESERSEQNERGDPGQTRGAESDLDSGGDLLSNGSWAAGDRQRPNSDQNL